MDLELLELIQEDIEEAEKEKVHKNKRKEKLVFDAWSTVEFYIENITEKEDGTIIVRTGVLSEQHQGEKYNHYFFKPLIEDKEKKPKRFLKSLRMLQSFLLAFFSVEEIKNNEVNIAKLKDKMFTAKACPVNEYNGKKYQSFISYQKSLPEREITEEEQNNLDNAIRDLEKESIKNGIMKNEDIPY